jgi:hypothetical protein
MPNKMLMFCGRRKGRIVPNHVCKPPCFAEEEDRQKLAAHYHDLRELVLMDLKEKGIFEPNPEEIFNSASERGYDPKTAFVIAAQVLPSPAAN